MTHLSSLSSGRASAAAATTSTRRTASSRLAVSRARAAGPVQQHQHYARLVSAGVAKKPGGAADDDANDVSPAAAAGEQIGRAADAAEGVITDAAVSASTVVEDAADSATALVDAAATAASNVAADAADVTSALARDASTAVRGFEDSVAAATSPSGGAIDWSLPAGGVMPDPRFKGLKVLVVGATGGVGRRVVQALRAKGVPCRALVRDRARAANLLPPPSAASGAASVSAAASATSTAAAAAAASLAASVPEFDVVTGDVYQFATLPAAFAGCNAVVVCSGANDKADPLGPFNTDYNGNLNLIAAAKAAGVKSFVLVTSIGADDILNPLNLFWGILFWKKRAEEALQRSGLRHAIVRPGGLKNRESQPGGIIMARPGTYGFPPLQTSGSILRSQVADVCVEALVCPDAAGKVVEVIADKDAAVLSLDQLFQGVRMVSW